MRFCKYCGKQIDEEAKICPACGKELKSNTQEQPADQTAVKSSGKTGQTPAVNTKAMIAIAAVALAALVFFLYSGGRCKWAGCSNKKAPGSDYCYSHKCVISDCGNKRAAYSNYCYEHSYYDEDDEEVDNSSYIASQLLISDIKLDKSGSYIKATGKITNYSSYTVSFVKIKGSFESAYGTVVDTDWTYAVDSVGLAPGETCKWEMSVKNDYQINNCSVSIIDLNVD